MNQGNMMLEEVRSRARMVLKALKGDTSQDEKETLAPVPESPADADRLDPRVEDSSPTTADLDAAKEPKEGEGDGGEDGEDPEFEDLNGEDGDGSEEGGSEGFDEFGHKDMDPREVKKAFPQIGHLFPDEAIEELEENETAPGAVPKVLGELVMAFKGMHDVLNKINSELNEIKKGTVIQGRELKKSLDANAELKTRLDKLHETVPPLGTPRAITKSLTPSGTPPGFTSGELSQLASSKKMDSLEISLLCLTGQRAE